MPLLKKTIYRARPCFLIIGMLLGPNPGARAEDASSAPPPSKAVATRLKTRIVIPALKSLQEIQKTLSRIPTREELESALMAQSVLSDNGYNCIAVISHEGELLACAPPAMAPLVKRTSDMPAVMRQVQGMNGAFLRESPDNPQGYRTYDLFLPMHAGGVYTNDFIGVYYTRFYPTRFLRDTVTDLDLPDHESFYILSEAGDVIFSSVNDAESPADILNPEYRASRSSMRTLFKRVKRETEGRFSYTSMADFYIGLLQHDLSWSHMELPGTTWLVLHDSIVPAPGKDSRNPLTGVWEAHRNSSEAQQGEMPAQPFGVSLVQEDTWWSMRGGEAEWPFRAEGRFLEGRMLSNRINPLDDQNQVVFSLQGRYDEVADQIYLEIYRQQKRRVITTSCVLKRSSPKQDNHEHLDPRIRFRILPESPVE